ncbi:MAG: YraN family protein [Actinobacteria bacterium]|nr:YraN family protein [Actinomycetota bacterium]
MSSTLSPDPRRSIGERGERIAERHLIRSGYRILERNFRTRHGEIDLVASDARTIVFCEVKTRVDSGRMGVIGPFDSIGPRKRRQVRSMASGWLQQRPPGRQRPARDELRFDAIGVTLAPDGQVLRVDHLQGAF